MTVTREAPLAAVPSDAALRFDALDQARRYVIEVGNSEDVVAVAERFYRFLSEENR